MPITNALLRPNRTSSTPAASSTENGLSPRSAAGRGDSSTSDNHQDIRTHCTGGKRAADGKRDADMIGSRF
ncbi:hypothetical protein LBMAG53_38290 [Planctomycetota bacterium]|nr:hypothetical protein LBMAG53_38290 [Planctomycetota bacterium]